MDTHAWLDDVTKIYRNYKEQCERASDQVSDEDFFATLGNYPSSIAVLFKHLGENNRSRWRDFLTSDGEKSDRDREAEFESAGETRAAIMKIWNNGWSIAFNTLETLEVDDLNQTITIRGQALTVPQAIMRNLTHLANHAGQIVLLARHFAGDKWESLSIPKGKSEEFNAAMREKYGDWSGKESGS